jgi:hypothetical protein
MAVLDSPITTYSDTTPQKRIITDVISLIDPTDAPLVNAIGGLDGAAGKFRFVNGNGTVVEWLEDTHASISDTMNESASITSTVTTITITDASLYDVGQIVLIDSELLWVSAASTSSNIISVTRGVSGSTAATHASTSSITFVGVARLEGAESSAIAFTDRTVGTNTTQIFHQEVKVTRSHSQISQYGISDEMAYQGDKVVPSQMRLIERSLFYNAAAAAGSATTPRIMAGIPAFVTTNKASGASLTQAKIESAIMSAYNNGSGGPWLLIAAPSNALKIKNLYDSSTVLRIDRTETTLGMNLTAITTPFGDAVIVIDRWCPSTLMPILDAKHVGLKTFYPFTQSMLAITGDYERSEVVGEFTFCLRQEKAHAFLTAVS